jgi:putative ABC transport system permease protein
MLTESVILALLGGTAGVMLAYWIIQTLRVSDVTGLPLTYQVSMNGWVLAFSLALSIVTGLLFGLAPGLQSFQSEVSEQLKSGKGEIGARSRFQFGRSALVISEVALSFALVVAAGLLYRSLVRLQEVDAGFTAPPQQVLTMQIAPRPVRGGSPDPVADLKRVVHFYQAVMERVQQLPETMWVAVSDSLPPAFSGEDDTFVIAGHPWNEREFPSTNTPKVSPDYFKALGVPIIRGRVFTASDTTDSAPVVVISESLAKKYFPNVDPVGQGLAPSGPGANPFAQIVGVVGDVKYWGLNTGNYEAYYQVYTQNSGPGMFLIVRSSGDAAAIARTVEACVREIDKEAMVRRTLTLDQIVNESVTQPRFRTTLLMSFALLALVLAGMGIYGVMAYSVSQRTQEMGIRMALGAPRASVLGLVMRHGALLTASGIVLGLLASLVSGKVLTSFLFGVRALDPVTIAEGALVLAVVALLATLFPALRATRIQPVEALRQS